jgi:glycosyltransferase involved in cell wall biosynthesis
MYSFRASADTPPGTPQAAARARELPAVSVIIPCCTRTETLEECLKSLRDQSFPSWEAIVVDDLALTEDPAALVTACNDRRIRVVSQERSQGLAAALNSGVRAARAELLLPLCAEDKIDGQFLARTCDALLQRPDADCVCTDFRLFGAGEGIWPQQLRDGAAMTKEQWMPGPGTLVRRALWRRLGGYCEDAELRAGQQDWDFWISAAAAGFTPLRIAAPLYPYRLPREQATLQRDEFRTRNHIERRHEAFFRRCGTGHLFRAGGYLNSAKASWERGERGRAALLAAEAWWLASGLQPAGPAGEGNPKEAAAQIASQLASRGARLSDELWYSFGRLAAGACAAAGAAADFLALLGEPAPLSRIRFRLGAELSFDRNEHSERSYSFKRGQLLKILGDHPLNVPLWLELGRISDVKGDRDSAAAAFQAALALDPGQAEALGFLARQTCL